MLGLRARGLGHVFTTCQAAAPWTARTVSHHGTEGLRMKIRSYEDSMPMIDMPDIDEDLEGYQIEAGAVFGQEDHTVPLSYGNNSKALYSIEEDAVIVDASDWMRLRVAGPDAESFLHGQLSVDVKQMKAGSGREACVLTPQGRVIDLIMLLRMKTGFMIICSPGMGETVKQHLEKHIFMSDNVDIANVTTSTVMFRVLGPKSNDILFTLQLGEDVLGGEFGTHDVVGFDNKPLIVIKGTDLGYSGYSLIVDESASGTLWKTLVSGFGVVPMGTEAWNIARIVSGRPTAGAELKESVTAFEAGLYHAVSLNKGCYVGQETLAKVYNLDANKNEIWGFVSEMPCSPGDEVFKDIDGTRAKIGKITSAADDISKTPVQHRSLGFLRRSGKNAALPTTWNNQSVLIGDNLVPGVVKSIPYCTRSLNPEDAPNVGAGKDTYS